MQKDISKTPAHSQWKKIGIKHHHGIDIPLFALHSKTSCGIGEYPDLIPIINWCSQVGFDVIQLLPLNDAGFETSPYSALSAYALNPWHLGLAQLPHLGDLKEQVKKLHSLCRPQRIDYKAVFKEKSLFLRTYYEKNGDIISQQTDYQNFIKNNPWLEEYGHFKGDVLYNQFLQYLCYIQMKEVRKAADKQGVFLKGDIPILINRDSVDVKYNTDYFLQEYSAGSPPDGFTPDGQDWDFPIYNWDSLEKNGYDWWKRRLDLACTFYHIYRIDHIVGFYRIFAIPEGLSAHEGIFIPEDERTWVSHGEKILSMMIKNCSMLPIGEDLAVIPNTIRESLQKLGICGTRVIRWETKPDGSYLPYDEYIAESMTTVSTHDAETLQLWWKHYPEEAKAFSTFKGWDYQEELSILRHKEILRDSHHTSSLFHINLLNEYLYLIPGMTWDDPNDERINYPGTVSDKNWTYRFRPSVEEIVANKELQDEIHQILEIK